jgi:hypothetical protein
VKLLSAEKKTVYEDELLICCSRVEANAETQQRVEQLLQQPMDWQRFLNLCWWHRVRPLAYRHLQSQPAGVVPPAVLEAFAKQARELEERNERLINMLGHVSGLFERSSIPMLVFKGPTLAITAYGDLNLRECGDLDMLIREADFPKVKEMLIADGFDCVWDQVDSERKRQLFACEFQRDGVELDVHWHLAPKWHNYEVDFDRLWESGSSIGEVGQYVRKMRPEDSLEVLCMHGTRHWWDRLRWICDIAELVNRGGITDWHRVEAKSTETRCHRSVWLGLWLANDLLDANLPGEIQAKLARSRVVKRLADQVGVWLENGEHAAEVRKLPDRFLFRMRLCERWRDRIPQLAHYLVTKPSRSLNWNP